LKRTAGKWKPRRKNSRRSAENEKVRNPEAVERSPPFHAQAKYNTPMPTIRFPAVMKYYVDNQAEFFVPASTVQELIDRLVENYPGLKFHLLDSEGQLRRHFNIFVNGTHIRDLNGTDTQLNEDDKVILMASAAGG
jgi:sulfur-carrier protein